MSHLQSAIVPDHVQAGILVEADISGGRNEGIKSTCRLSLESSVKLKTRFPNGILGLAIVFGSRTWQSFDHTDEGNGIKPFPELDNGLAPSTQYNLYIHIQTTKQKVTYVLAQSVLDAFGSSIYVTAEERGLRLYKNRGLGGFIDGTEDPQGGDDIRNVAIISEGKPDIGGSYVLLQEYLHDLKKQDAVPTAKQEASVGRNKGVSGEFSKDMRLPDPHLGRVNVRGNGVGLRVVHYSLPFGKINDEHGLMFTSYCDMLHNVEIQLFNMFGDADGKTNLLLKYLSKAVSGAYYYAPSVKRLQSL